ncbi:hypothetical protein D3C76_851010 [compost metagenome]
MASACSATIARRRSPVSPACRPRTTTARRTITIRQARPAPNASIATCRLKPTWWSIPGVTTACVSRGRTWRARMAARTPVRPVISSKRRNGRPRPSKAGTGSRSVRRTMARTSTQCAAARGSLSANSTRYWPTKANRRLSGLRPLSRWPISVPARSSAWAGRCKTAVRWYVPMPYRALPAFPRRNACSRCCRYSRTRPWRCAMKPSGRWPMYRQSSCRPSRASRSRPCWLTTSSACAATPTCPEAASIWQYC